MINDCVEGTGASMKRLLIVEDEPRTRDALCSLIDWKSIGIDEVIVAEGSEEGLSSALNKEPSVIIADVQMPGIDGIEMSKRIIQTLPLSRVIILSAYDNTSYFQRAIRAGVVDYLLKPVNPKALTSAVIQALEEKAGLEWDLQKQLYLQTLLRSNQNVIEQSFVERLTDAYANAPPDAEELITLCPLVSGRRGAYTGLIGRITGSDDTWPTALLSIVKAFFRRNSGLIQQLPVILQSLESETFLIIITTNSSDSTGQVGIIRNLAALLSTSLSCDVQTTVSVRTLDELIAAVFAVRHVLFGSKTSGANSRHEGGIAANVVKIIDEYLADDHLSVVFIAEKLQFTSAYICMAFKKQRGITVNDYINMSRLEEAKRLIRDSDLKLYEIAEESGFQSESYFARVFRKYLAMSPGEYRDRYARTGI